jgi:hypothetical protein
LVLALTALTGAAVTPLSAADYKHSGCSEAAKMRFPIDHAARKSSSIGVRTVGKSIRKSILNSI